MPLYTVLAPTPPSPSDEPDPLAIIFVKDGFCWPSLFLAVVWMVYRRLWLVLLLYLVAVAILVILGRIVGGPLPPLLFLFFHVFVALQANAFRRWTLARRGYRLAGVAEGRRVGDAETRFFHQGVEAPPRRDPRQPPPARLQAVLGMPARPLSAETGDVVGLFPAGPGGAA